MRIHTKLERSQVEACVPKALKATITEHRSQSHPRAFEVSMVAPEGTDSWGNKRTQAPYHGGEGDYPRAATWVEWGDFISAIFVGDNEAMVPRIYKNAHDFIVKTQAACVHRAEPSAEESADEWSKRIYYHSPERMAVLS